jgi:3-hydroxybutyryl-CoA dehydratase
VISQSKTIAESLAFDELEEGRSYSGRFTIDDAQMDSFAALCGDHNPLHCDADYARCRGFEGRVVYGALQVAQISRVIGMELPGSRALWTTLDIQFIAPLYVAEEALIRAEITVVSPATRSLRMKLWIERGETLLSKGKAGVSVRDDG